MSTATALSVDSITTTNPATGADLTTYPATGDAGIDAALDRSAAAQQQWSRLSPADRGAVIGAAAGVLRRRVAELALLITREMGKPLAESRAEVEKCAWACDYYAEHAGDFLADELVTTGADDSWVSYEPVGLVLAVMPWNFPLWQVFRFAAPALMAGNGALLKHSPNTTGCALAVADILAEAGAPVGLFAALVVPEPQVPATTTRIIADPRVGAVTVTGSERAGVAVAVAAGRAIKKSVLELGGSDPFVVLADADLAATAILAAKSRFLNGGQSCISAKRFIVEAPVADQFTRLFVAAVEALTIGDPEQPGTDIGPMARADLVDGIDRQVQASVAAGATVLTGGHKLVGESALAGNYYAPTVLGSVTPGMPVYDEETFGPVAAVIVADDIDDAVRIANDTPFGLAASVWTSDSAAGVAVGKRITSGACFVNAVVASDVRMPFGGTRRSGYGRELAQAGIREFVNTRTWVLNNRPPTQAPASE
ncbi:NAD-dependent succinate-semialdehyde dehydrogenase [Nakamurella deserti]|uniref:NAD-dependent succinate-semialdehyde dehydrogenase n=1 Tax=Nakamurella deserti TaxID=2164074 RepID=UPI00197C9814|nr:NAD-dependent succinate-semialdehyde dehydrogenase [Nakamurella deserti]